MFPPREAFEAWIKKTKQGADFRREPHTDGYVDPQIHMMWNAWKAGWDTYQNGWDPV